MNPQPLTLPEYRKMDLSQLPLKEQRRYWKLLNRQARVCFVMCVYLYNAHLLPVLVVLWVDNLCV